MYVQIKENKDLIRDTESRALLNTNRGELEAYYAERDIKIKEMQEKQALESKVNKLEQDISDIKSLLQQLVTRT
jgi:hypothetical protein